MSLQQRIKAPPRKRGGAGAQLPDWAKTKTSKRSVTRKTRFDNPPPIYNDYRLFCFWRGQAIYAPPAGRPDRVYSVLRKGALIALTPEEITALNAEIIHKLAGALFRAEKIGELEAVI